MLADEDLLGEDAQRTMRCPETVERKLRRIIKSLDQACEAATGEEHRIAAEKAETIKTDLEELSEDLRIQIENGAFGRRL